STLVKILSGAQAPDSGEIRIGDRSFRRLDPLTSRAAGVAAVYQNAELHLDLSVAANIFLGAEPRTRLHLIDDAEIRRRAEQVLSQIGLKLPVDKRLGDLDAAERQQVAIAKAVREQAHVLLLDEPTAALNKNQADFLFKLIRDLAGRGLAIVYISHHLDEVLSISDRITILRNGRKVQVTKRGEADKDSLISMIVGHDIDAVPADEGGSSVGDTFLALQSISMPTKLNDISLEVGKGEIVGLTGLIGSGCNELAAVIAGIEKADGQMMLDGTPYAPRSVDDAIRRGVIFIPEEMRLRGLVMPMSVAGNISLSLLSRVSRFSVLRLKREAALANDISEHLDLQPRGPEREVRFLSGGNQRKALLGRAIFAGARLFVLEEPTQGVDVEAQRQIHEHLRNLAAQGTTIVFVSTDLEELLALSHRILVMKHGAISQILAPSGLTPETLLATIQA
ncbi:MAG TPA: sugar ABC transporter ATP-binding protein, partial [Pararhizobium sp.]|nr:sugar ABC transporter ATP-binding protein [Pararhizobium sp.]